MAKQVLPQFGEAVTRVLKEHNLSDRGAQYRTGIDRITLADMRNGYQVRMEQVVKFANGFGLDVNEWLELAGYEPIHSPAEEPEQLLQRLVELAESDPDALPVDPDLEEEPALKGFRGAEDLSENDVRTISRIRAAIQTLKRRQRGEGGE